MHLVEVESLVAPTVHQASSEQARFFDYRSAANPQQSGLIASVPFRSFSPDFFDQTGCDVLPLDLSEQLGCSGPATGPSLCANFVRLDRGEQRTSAIATSQLFFITNGEGETQACGSGACAAVAHGVQLGLLASDVAVHIPGGKLTVSWQGAQERVWLGGPATTVFNGTISLRNG